MSTKSFLAKLPLYLALVLGIQSQSSTKEYDYIVVGSGPGGGTLAVELAKAGFKTLLIEAGPKHTSETTQIPVMHFNSSEDPITSLNFTVNHFDGDKGYFYPRAAALGGCAVHHAMIALYPNARDFNELSDITRDKGWSEPEMRKYLKRIENNQYLTKNAKTQAQHGFNGWLPISQLDFSKFVNVNSVMLDLVERIAGDINLDANGYNNGGLTTDAEGRIYLPQFIDKKTFTRFDFGDYINRAVTSFGLDVWTNTFATKLIMDKKVVRGVEYARGSHLYKASPLSTFQGRIKAQMGKVMARREVIVSGGAFMTPQLLMLSGIGDKRELRKLGIKPVSDLPGVGRNMMDRYEVPYIIKFPQNFRMFKGCKFEVGYQDDCYNEYKTNLTGPYTTNGGVSAEMRKSSPNLEEPDLLMLNVLADFRGYYTGYSKDLKYHRDSFTQLATLGHTGNSGYVRLKSKSPFDVPEINFQFFAKDPENLETLIENIKYQRNYFKDFPGDAVEVLPGPDVVSDEQLREFVKDITWGHHACCTARIGKKRDKLAVLDDKFRVRGVKNLRVVDASSLPSLPGYFPSLLLHMMSTRAAEIIISEAK